MKHRLFLSIFLVASLLASGQMNLPTRTIGKTDYYYRQVEKKETLYGIAKELGISQETIIKYNPSVQEGLKKDQWLYFPVNEFDKTERQAAAVSDLEHIVESGETVYGLSKMYGITIEELILANPEVKQGLKTGTVIRIPKNDGFNRGDGIMYTIKKGETLYRISKNNNVTIEALMEANPGISPTNFKSGETIIIPPANREEAKKNSQPTTVFVAEKIEKGDTFDNIAEKYDVDKESIIDANPDNTKPKKGSYVYIPITSEAPVITDEQTDSTYQTIHEINDTGVYNISLLLPFDIDKEKISLKGNLGYDFYGGFLLGLKKYANKDVSIKLNVYDITQQTLYSILNKEELKESDIIISSYEDYDLSRLFDYGQKNKISIFNPFSIKDETFYEKDRAFQLSTPSSYMYDGVKNFINSQMKDCRIVIISDEQSEEKELIKYIKQTGCSQQVISIEDLAPETFRALVSDNKDILLVPAQSSKEFLHKISAKLTALKKSATTYNLALFGYPEWATYTSYTPFFHKFGTYIYTRYAPTDKDTDAASIAKDFEYWYGRKPSVTMPQMDVFGYDMANYIIRVAKESQLDFNNYDKPFEGIHCPVYLHRVSNWGGFVNSSIYILKYGTNGTIKKILVK